MKITLKKERFWKPDRRPNQGGATGAGGARATALRHFAFVGSRSLFAELHLMQSGVETTLRQKLVVGAHLADLALVEDDDLIRFPDGRESMGDDD
jgi:hypothetical protein